MWAVFCIWAIGTIVFCSIFLGWHVRNRKKVGKRNKWKERIAATIEQQHRERRRSKAEEQRRQSVAAQGWRHRGGDKPPGNDADYAASSQPTFDPSAVTTTTYHSDALDETDSKKKEKVLV